jgi:hypothetical protein
MSKEVDKQGGSLTGVILIVGVILLPAALVLGLSILGMSSSAQGGSTAPQPIVVGPTSPVKGLLTDFKRFSKPADYLAQDGQQSLDLLNDRLNTIILAIDNNDSKYSGLGNNAQEVRRLAADACTRIQAVKAAVLAKKIESATTEANQLFADLKKINELATNSTGSEDNDTIIRKLYPTAQSHFTCLITEAAKQGYDLRITEGMRTIDRQNELYAQGRTKPGSIVTNAKGGDSWHNYGLAIDVVDRKLGYNLTDSRWAQLGDIGSACGLKWGGTFSSFKDMPHFQYMGNPPLTLKDLKENKRPQ